MKSSTEKHTGIVQDAGYEVFGIVSVKDEGEGGHSAVHVDELELHKPSVLQALKTADVVVCNLRSHHEASIWLLCQAAALSRNTPATFIAISDPLVWGCTDVTDIKGAQEAQTPPQTVEPVQAVQQEAQPAAEHEDMPSAEQQDASGMDAATDGLQDSTTDGCNGAATEAGQRKEERFKLKGEHYTKRQPTPEMSHIFRAENTLSLIHI